MFRNTDELLKESANDTKTYAEIASEHPEFLNFLRMQRTEAIGLCMHLKKNFNLTDEQIPCNISWDPCIAAVSNTALSFDAEELLPTAKNDGRAPISVLMWMFNIEWEELLEAKADKSKEYHLHVAVEPYKEGELVDSRNVFSFEKAEKLADQFINHVRNHCLCEKEKKDIQTPERIMGIVNIKPEQEKEFRCNSRFQEASQPNYPIPEHELKEGEIGMLNGFRLISEEKRETKESQELSAAENKIQRTLTFEMELPLECALNDVINKKLTKGAGGPVVGKVISASWVSPEDSKDRRAIITGSVAEDDYNQIIHHATLDLSPKSTEKK